MMTCCMLSSIKFVHIFFHAQMYLLDTSWMMSHMIDALPCIAVYAFAVATYDAPASLTPSKK